MEQTKHTLEELFLQLGLPHAQAEIDAFIASNRPVPRHLPIEDAHFWTEAQRQLLRDCREDDADWAPIVDDLSTRLH